MVPSFYRLELARNCLGQYLQSLDLFSARFLLSKSLIKHILKLVSLDKESRDFDERLIKSLNLLLGSVPNPKAGGAAYLMGILFQIN